MHSRPMDQDKIARRAMAALAAMVMLERHPRVCREIDAETSNAWLGLVAPGSRVSFRFAPLARDTRAVHAATPRHPSCRPRESGDPVTTDRSMWRYHIATP